MKIAIRGHRTRKKEVAQILESLGGKNRAEHTFAYNDLLYYLDSNNLIICALVLPSGYREYTLEEFEKEFPFKIGDKVKHITSVCTIRKYCYINNKPVYEVESVELGIIATIPVELLELYKEMKEERNITLALDKAKEWYKKGGELREIALQAFTEMELNSLPRSWKDYCKNYPIKPEEIFIDGYSKFIVNHVGDRNSVHDKNICPSRKSAEAHLAMIQLEQLRDCWRQGWEPNWLEGNVQKYVIQKWRDKISIETTYVTHSFLSFPTYEIAKEFLECFRDLIEQAGDLI